jgi:energy-coupling factor transporter ATP-binding protein EcfA2
MIELRRIIMIDWYLFRAEQIDMRGMTALIGPNGAGKSAVIDAVQTVLTGANMSSIRFNPSAQSNAKSKRSIRDYCLGVVSLDEKGERSEPTRSHAYTYVVLGFEDVEDGSTTSVGIAFAASSAKGDESCEARFLVRGPIDMSDLLAPVGADEVETMQWFAVRTALRSKGIEVEDGYSSASEFVEEVLHALSPAGFPQRPAVHQGIPQRAPAQAGRQSYRLRPQLRARRSADPDRSSAPQHRPLALPQRPHREPKRAEREPLSDSTHRRARKRERTRRA